MNLRSISLIIIGLVLLGVAVWYAAFGIQNQQQENVTKEQSTAPKETPEEDDSKFAELKGEEFDEAYIADMLAHHEGAVNMSELASAQTQRDEVRKFAQEIMNLQSQEIYQMRTWQDQWGYEVSMGGHGQHSGDSGQMAGEMHEMSKKLEGLSGEEFDKEFFKQMIAHHQQAIKMSKYAKTNAHHQEIKELAADIIRDQTKEIEQMQQWQQEWGY